jgi:hypothetical protein
VGQVISQLISANLAISASQLASQLDCFTCNRVVAASFLRLFSGRSLAMFAALIMSLLISAEGADATLKSEWKFGGSLAHFMSLPFDATAFGTDPTGGSFAGDVPAANNSSFLLVPRAAQPTGGSLGGLFNRPGIVGGFSAGFLGAGVLGLVFGHGMTSELTGTASFFGLIFQITLILMFARLFWGWWRADRSSAFTDMSPRQLADAYGRFRNETQPDIDMTSMAETGDAKTFDRKD